MHDYTMCLADWVKEHYCPDNMTRNDLDELVCWSKVIKNMLEGDKDYHVILGMTEGVNENEMDTDEFITRFKSMYNSADATTKAMVKNEIHKITG